MAFCGNCGNKLNDWANFCPKCGTSVKGDASIAIVSLIRNKMSKPFGRNIIIMSLILLLIVCVFGGTRVFSPNMHCKLFSWFPFFETPSMAVYKSKLGEISITSEKVEGTLATVAYEVMTTEGLTKNMKSYLKKNEHGDWYIISNLSINNNNYKKNASSYSSSKQNETNKYKNEKESTVDKQIDITPILNECQMEITAIQREIEQTTRIYVSLASQDIDQYKYVQMRSTYVDGVNKLVRKADKAFDNCANKLKAAGVTGAESQIKEEKRNFHSAIYELRTRATQTTDGY